MAEAAWRSLINCLRAAIVRYVPNNHSAIIVSEPLAPLPAALLLQHRHRLLLIHLPRLDPSINRAAGTRFTEMVREVTVELIETQLENKHV